MNNAKLTALINHTFENLEGNNFSVLGRPEKNMWEKPLIGIVHGADPYYDFLKTHIGSFHWSVSEAFALKYKDEIRKDNLRVISLVFPQTEETKSAQRKAVNCPSIPWIVTRGEWENLMKEFSGKLVQALEERNIRAVAIDLQPEFKREHSQGLGIASRWSHRHTAFAAGLGTFGLSDGLITEKGKAVRLTSIIVECPLEPTPKTYIHHYEWCLYHKNGSCGACIPRCPASAITYDGHNKEKCSAYEAVCIKNYWPDEIEKGDYIFGCGLCQAAVPCQNKRP